MDPVIYIVILAAAVLFLSNIFRGEKENRETKRPRPGDQPRSQEANVDRFLEEINRRRREANDRRTARVPPAAPAPPPRRQESSQLQSARRTDGVAAETVRLPSVPEFKPYASSRTKIGKPAPSISSPPAPAVAVPLVVTEVEPESSGPAPEAAKITFLAPAAAPARLMPLLRSPQGLRSAILLQEILAPPLARRPRRRR
jgi:hypothetical protein